MQKQMPDGPHSTNRLAFLRSSIPSLVASRDHRATEVWSRELVAAVAASADRRGHVFKPSQLAWYAERVQAVKHVLETQFTENHSLADLARSVGMSAFHFARIFRQLMGIPPHQYLLRLRLRHAHQLLLDGVSVTDVCFDVGFSNLSHFIRLFKSRFGYTPSSVHAGRRRRRPSVAG